MTDSAEERAAEAESHLRESYRRKARTDLVIREADKVHHQIREANESNHFIDLIQSLFHANA